MSENIFSAVLTLSLLAGGTVAFGSEMIHPKQAATQVVTLPPVTVVGQRLAAREPVVLPTVVVTGHRCNEQASATEVAAETGGAEHRVQ
jgi:hypothetical protein